MIREGDLGGDSTIKDVIERQTAWAAEQGLTLSPGGQAFSDPASALFVDQLCPETIDELTEGAGAELNRIWSLRSSSCLVLNVFEPWRKNPGALGDIFGAEADSLSFEAKQPTGLKGVAPHLDVLLTGPAGSVAVESKFLEMYTPTDNHFAESYFAREDLWAGLGNTRELAVRIADGSEQFRWLHAAQLLKHALGLSKNQQTDFRLVLLWYRVEGPIAEDLEAEIGRFTRAVSDNFDFTSMTHQELATRLSKVAEPMPGYFSYPEGASGIASTPRIIPRICPAMPSQVGGRSEGPNRGGTTITPMSNGDTVSELETAAEEAFNEGRFQDSLDFYDDALELATKSGDRARLYHLRSTAYRRAGNPMAALEDARLARDLADSHNLEELAAEAELTVGNAMADMDRFAEAESSLQRARKLFEAQRRFDPAAQAIIGISRVLAETERLNEALEILTTLADATAKSSGPIRSQVLNNLGAVYRRMGRSEEALAAYSEDYKLCEAKGDTYGQLISLINTASLLEEKGEVTRARSTLETARKLTPASHATHLMNTVTQSIDRLSANDLKESD